MIEREKIGERLESFCKNNFESQEAFAKKIGIASSNLRKFYFSGKSLPGSELLVKLSEIGCDIKWLLTGEESIMEAQPNYDSNTEMSQEELDIINKLRLVPATLPLISKLLQGIVISHEALQEIEVLSSCINSKK